MNGPGDFLRLGNSTGSVGHACGSHACVCHAGRYSRDEVADEEDRHDRDDDADDHEGGVGLLVCHHLADVKVRRIGSGTDD